MTAPARTSTASPAATGAVNRIWRDDPVLARIGSLIDLDAADLRSLRAVIETELTVTKRRDLVLDGYEFCKLCFVKDGFAARYKLLRNGKRQIVNFVLPGDVIGLPGSFLNRAVNSVVAVTDMTLQICSLQAYVDLSYRQPKFGLLLGWLAAQEAAHCAEHVIDVGRRAPIERLAHLLLEIHSRLALVGLADPYAFTLPFTQELMSDALGLSVPHLNRTLGKLRAERLIAVNERHVAFIDLKALQMLAQFQPAEPARVPLPEAIAIN
jgi:CRP-like cAMP-binding protein